MYERSRFSNMLRKVEGNIIFYEDPGDPNYAEYYTWVLQENGPTNVDCFFEETAAYNFHLIFISQKDKYVQRAYDGLEYQKETRALVKAKAINEEITEAEYDNTTDALSAMRLELAFGDWEKALRLLTENEALMPGSIYTPIYNYISAYVGVSYSLTSEGLDPVQEAQKASSAVYLDDSTKPKPR
jgi:hypothetical protein